MCDFGHALRFILSSADCFPFLLGDPLIRGILVNVTSTTKTSHCFLKSSQGLAAQLHLKCFIVCMYRWACDYYISTTAIILNTFKQPKTLWLIECMRNFRLRSRFFFPFPVSLVYAHFPSLHFTVSWDSYTVCSCGKSKFKQMGNAAVDDGIQRTGKVGENWLDFIDWRELLVLMTNCDYYWVVFCGNQSVIFGTCQRWQLWS